MNENLNKALGQLEEDLKKMQSARKQVESVIASNKEFVDATSGLVTNTQSLVGKLKETTETKVKEVSELASKNIKDTSNLAKTTIEDQRQENLKTLNHILETHNQIKQLMGQLLNLDLPNTLKSLNANLEKWQQVSNQQFKTTKTIQISTLVAVGVFGIAIVLKLSGII
jgi:hypothetical protein